MVPSPVKSLLAAVLAVALAGPALAAGDAGLKPPKPAAANLADKSPRCEPAKVNECRTTCDRKKYESTNKDEVAKQQYECKQECIRGC